MVEAMQDVVLTSTKVIMQTINYFSMIADKATTLDNQ